MPIFVCAAPQIRWIQSTSDVRRAHVEVSGLPGSFADTNALSVYADQGDPIADAALPRMLGEYTFRDGILSFKPMFPVQSDVKYRAVFRSPNADPIVSTLKITREDPTPTTVVMHIYPSADVLPENLLKFYVHFSAPMSRGHIYNHIELRNESGQPVELPFLEIDEELWDDKMQRLTLFIDPGRIKRGVQPLEEVGPALEEGKKFTLIIRKQWQDASGRALKTDFTKHFRVGPPDRDPPDPKTWTIKAPKAETKDALRILFHESMDHALTLRVVSVANFLTRGTLGDHERELVLTPHSHWKPGHYDLTVQTTIEDLAGNNIGKPFEVDLFEGVQRRLTNSLVKIPFEIQSN